MINDALRSVVLVEKSLDEGEDGEPVIVRGKNSVALAVFDGLGGSAAYGKEASTVVSEFTKEFLQKHVDGLLTEEFMLDFERQANALLLREAQRLPQRGKKYQCATTIALAKVVVQDDGTYRTQLSWAGDSRVYFLSPTKGLQVLTLDDTWRKNIKPFQPVPIRPQKDSYTLDHIYGSDATGHCLAEKKVRLSWDTNVYEINFKEEIIREPGIFIVCTDGAYSNYFSVRYEEQRYLKFINDVNSAEQFQSYLAKYFERTKDFSDDAVSIIMQPVGFSDFAEMKERFAQRSESIRRVEPPDFAAQGGTESDIRLKYREYEERLWREYFRDHYTEMLFTDNVRDGELDFHEKPETDTKL